MCYILFILFSKSLQCSPLFNIYLRCFICCITIGKLAVEFLVFLWAYEYVSSLFGLKSCAMVFHILFFKSLQHVPVYLFFIISSSSIVLQDIEVSHHTFMWSQHIWSNTLISIQNIKTIYIPIWICYYKYYGIEVITSIYYLQS